MIIRDEDKQEFLIRPSDAVEITFSTNGSVVTIDYDIEPNCEYIVVIKDVKDNSGNKLAEPLVYSFTSQYTPLFATINQIKTDIGRALTEVPSDLIYRSIRSNSMDVQYLVSAAKAATTNWDDPPYDIRQYVRYQTDVDIMLDQYAESSTQTSDRVQLGDFAVQGGGSSQAYSYKMILDELKKRAQYWKNRIGASPVAKRPSSYVKGGTDWPDYLSRGF